MKAKDLRKQTKAKLEERLVKAGEEIKEMAFGFQTGTEKDLNKYRKLKKEVARILTVINQGSYSTKAEKAEVNTKAEKTEKAKQEKKAK